MRIALFACVLAITANTVRLDETEYLPEPVELPATDAHTTVFSEAEIEAMAKTTLELETNIDALLWLVDDMQKDNELMQTMI